MDQAIETGIWRLVWIDLTSAPAVLGNDWTDDLLGAVHSKLPLIFRGRQVPVLISPEGWPDEDLLLYFDEGAPSRANSVATYFKEYRLFFDFLLHHHAKRWNEATYSDLKDYGRHRLQVNAGSTWNKKLGAIASLYDWAVEEELISASPVRKRLKRIRGEDRATSALTQKNSKNADVKYLTRRRFQRFIDVGMLGLNADGLPASGDRLRAPVRNAAYAQLLYRTGMRRVEAAGLLTVEVPTDQVRGWIPSSLGKGGKGRVFYLGAAGRRELSHYVSTEREIAIAQARQAGAYERPDLIHVDKLAAPRHGLISKLKIDGTWVALDRLMLPDRQRLVIDGEHGREPLALWLRHDTGLPISESSWNRIFKEASERCDRRGVPIAAQPHHLRHSFALHRLVAAQRAYTARGMTDDERRDYQVLFGNAWLLVSQLLGHADVRTTKNIYLAPVRGIEIEALLSGDDVSELDDMLSEIAKLSRGEIGDDVIGVA